VYFTEVSSFECVVYLVFNCECATIGLLLFSFVMADQSTNDAYCCACNKRLRKARKRPVNRDAVFLEHVREHIAERRSAYPDEEFDQELNDSDILCDSCYHWFVRKQSNVSEASGSRQRSTTSEPTSITLNIPRSTKSHKRCLFGCFTTQLHRVPEKVRQDVLVRFRFNIVPGARVCSEHNVVRWTEVPQLPLLSDYTAIDIEEMVDSLRGLYSRTRASLFNFDYVEDMESDTVFSWTGLSKEQFLELSGELNSLSTEPHLHAAVGLYLAKLRTGESDERLASLFHIARSTAERLMQKARQSFVVDFVPRHLGFSHVSRDDILQETTTVANTLFNQDEEHVITIWDGTYIYIQKSGNYAFQRQSYSMHKHDNLMKPLLAVTTNGYILEVFGLYAATMSDAVIMNHIFTNNQEVIDFFEEHDVFLVDRGFRDSLPLLQRLGYDVHMPHFIPRSDSQLSTLAANKSRLVTKCRFVIEAQNGRLKQCFRYFDKQFQNKSVPHLLQDFRVSAALLNRFHPRIESDSEHSEEIAKRILENLNRPNKLQTLVEAQRLNRIKRGFVSLTEFEIDDFPQFSENQLCNYLSLGTYQLKQAKCYVAEHMKNAGRYTIDVARHGSPLLVNTAEIRVDNPLLIRARIHSRFRSTALYYVYVLIDCDQDGTDSIIEHYCQCKNGSRTVGCCAHIMSVIWYLGYGRHHLPLNAPAEYLEEYHIVLENTDDESEDEEE